MEGVPGFGDGEEEGKKGTSSWKETSAEVM